MANKFYHAAQEFKQNAKYPKSEAQKAKAKAKRKEGWAQMKKGFKESLVDATIEGGKMLGKYATAGALFKDSGAISTVKKGLQGTIDLALGLGKVIFNHPDWYLHGGYQNLIAANFATKKGVPSKEQLSFTVWDEEIHTEPVQLRCVAAPNVISYQTYPVKPINDQGGWNLGVQRLYNMLRAANSGARNYEQLDVEGYLLTQRTILIYLHCVRRVIGTYSQFAYFDVQIPKQLLNAMGVQDTGAADIPGLINAYNRACAWFCAKFPMKLTLHERDAWLYNNIFCDSDDAKCNYHIFCPALLTLPVMNNNRAMINLNTAGFKFKGDPENPVSVADMITDLDTIATLPYNGLFDVIAGDVIKAWGMESIYKLIQIDNTYRTPTIYDEYALSQIQNIDLLSQTLISGFDETTNVFEYSYTKWATTYTASEDGYWSTTPSAIGAADGMVNFRKLYEKSILNSPTDEQDPGRILSFTRLKSSIGEPAKGFPTIATCGTEFVGTAWIFYTISKTGTDVDTKYQFGFLPMGKINSAFIVATASPTYSNFLYRFFGVGIQRFAWSNLDYAPKVLFGYTYYIESGDKNVDVIDTANYDLNNFAILDPEMIKTYHGIADQSLIYTTVGAKMAGSYDELKF